MGIRSGFFAAVATLGLTTGSVAADHDHHDHHIYSHLKADPTKLTNTCDLTRSFMRSMDASCNSWPLATGNRKEDVRLGWKHLRSHGIEAEAINAAIHEAVEECCDNKGKADGICAQIHHYHH